ncbi:MAG: sensor histidine kinase [Ruminococcaceae bacterium]|nr:sensor histidine kinase [Oscillospiraceae bacterium]
MAKQPVLPHPFRNLKLRTKLIAIFFLTNASLILVLSLAAYWILSSTVREKVTENISITASQIAFSTDSSIGSVNRLLDYIFTNQELQQILAGETDLDDAGKNREIRAMMDGYFVNTPELMACLVSDSKGSVYYYRRNVSDKEQISRWIASSIAADGQTTWLGSYELSEMKLWTDRTYVVTRAIKNLDSKDVVTPVGTITLLFSDRLLADSFRYIGEETILLIADSRNQPVSSVEWLEDPSDLLSQLDHLPEDADKPFDLWLGSELYMMSVHPIPSAGWQVVEAIPYREISKNFSTIELVTAFTLLLSLLGALAMSFFFSKKIAAPLLALNQEMQKVSAGSFDVCQFPQRSDEIGQIQRGFNEMVSRMQILLQTTVEKEKEKQLAELTALQYQINPHFLYNTLGAVRLMALMTKSQNIVSMLDSLIRLLRKSAGKLGTTLTLAEEMDTIGDFVTIHRIRYQHEIRLDDQIPEELKRCLVPCFLLQPLVENAIFHGFNETGGGTITFTGTVEEGVLTLSVVDDGAGMTPERIEAVLSSELPERTPYFSIGIKNVDSRLKINFGPQYGLRLESEPGKGTRVTVTLPAQYNEKVDFNEDHDRG